MLDQACPFKMRWLTRVFEWGAALFCAAFRSDQQKKEKKKKTQKKIFWCIKKKTRGG